MTLARLLLPFLSLVDILLTYWVIKTLMKINPKKEKEVLKIELNRLTRVMWGWLGFKKGTLVWGILSVTAFFIAGQLISINFVYFFLGVLTITNIIHINNVSQITESKQYKKMKGKNKR